MSGRHQPTEGADSPASLVYHAFRVHIEEELGARFWIDVPRALGKYDAEHQAIEKARDRGFFDCTALEVKAA